MLEGGGGGGGITDEYLVDCFPRLYLKKIFFYNKFSQDKRQSPDTQYMSPQHKKADS